jgi:hypothetical protein
MTATVIAQTESTRMLVLGAPMPVALLILLAVVAVLALVYTYRTERRGVGRLEGMVLPTLRGVLGVLIVVMFAEPVLSTRITESSRPRVIVLVDDSTSMDIADTHITPGRQLRLADDLGMLDPAARPLRLKATEATVRRAAADLQRPREFLRSRRETAPKDDPALGRFQAETDKVISSLDQVVRDLTTATQTKPTGNALPDDIVQALGKLGQQVANHAVASLREPTIQVQAMDEIMATLTATADDLGKLADTADEAMAGYADAAAQQAMKNAAAMSRRGVAAQLLHPDPGRRIPEILRNTDIEVYLFTASTQTAQIEAIAAAQSQPSETSLRSQTDITHALETATAGRNEAPIAGVILATDGRHNTGPDPLETAARMGAAGIGIYPLMIGSTQPPTDAVILEADAPNAVYVEDAADITAAIKLDGLEGKPATVRLLDPEGTVLDERKITPDSDHHRAEVTLSHTPGEKGRFVYEVELVPMNGEILTDNNRRTLAVDVNDDRTKVLIVDGAPRWEFRYLRNVLLRDLSVRLQTVLFEPPYIESEPPRDPVAAQATRDDPEADRLPETAEDLNAFDLIVLGDTAPADLTSADQRRIDAFVAERGGTLVIIAGKAHMPASFAGQPVAGLLPVVDATNGSNPPKPAGAFRIRLTAEGRSATMTRFHADGDENLELWTKLPQVYWRSSWHQAKGGASILAFADLDADRAATPTTTPASQPIDAQDHALISTQHYGLGKVLFLGWDATWRLRYKTGDKLHHKFWRQILRWATESKLPTGLARVKLGTDKARYVQDEPVVVRVKLSKPDLTPVTDAMISADIRRGDEVVRTARLRFVTGSAGIYEARFTDLPAGELSVVLDGPVIESLRQPDDPPGEVMTRIVIDPVRSVESLNLAANEPLLQRLADVSGGTRITPADLRTFRATLNTEPIRNVTETHTEVWNSWWLLIAFVTVITVEWLVRKSAGLM